MCFQGPQRQLARAGRGEVGSGWDHAATAGKGGWRVASICKPTFNVRGARRCLDWFPGAGPRVGPARCLAAARQPRSGAGRLPPPAWHLGLFGPRDSGFMCLCFKGEAGKGCNPCCAPRAAWVLAYGVICPGWNRKKQLNRFSWYPTCSCLLHFKYFILHCPFLVSACAPLDASCLSGLLPRWAEDVPLLSGPAAERFHPLQSFELTFIWRESEVFQLWGLFPCQTDFKRAVLGEFEVSRGYQRADP